MHKESDHGSRLAGRVRLCSRRGSHDPVLPCRLTPTRPFATLVPPNLEVPAQNKVFLVGHAAGTQQYICLFSGSSFDWTFFGPQATFI